MLEQAVELNPRNSPLRIELGEYAEQAGDFATAEAAYRSAMALDHTYAPRGELAGFYFHRRDRARFIETARDALEVGQRDEQVLFEECWALIGNGDEILRVVIPDKKEVLQRYMEFLLSTNRGKAADPVIKRVMAAGGDDKEIREAILTYCDQMIAAGNQKEAVNAWNWLRERTVVGGSKPDARELLTNREFKPGTINRGFDWRYENGSGIYYERVTPGVLKLSFSGKQPENYNVLWQPVALEGKGRYRLRVKYLTPERDSGLRWEVLAGGKDLLDGKGALTDSGEGERTLEFDGPAAPGLGSLVLRYERVRGTVRVEGDAEIRDVELARE
jgi:tetratricopeptide (TPR) repeat protein